MSLLLGCVPNEESQIILSLKGVIITPYGVIIVQRSSGCSVYSGFWEFPGGKFVEGCLDANLKKELREEMDQAILGTVIGGLQCIFVHLEQIETGKNIGKTVVFLYFLLKKKNFIKAAVRLEPSELQDIKYVMPNTKTDQLALRPFTRQVLGVVFERYWY